MQIDVIKLAAAFRMIAEALEERDAKVSGEEAPDTNVVAHPAAAAFGTPPATPPETWAPETSVTPVAPAQAQMAQAQLSTPQVTQAQMTQAQAPSSLQPQIINALQMMAQKMGPESVPAFLSSHGFNRVSEIPVERHAEILQDLMKGLQ